MLKGDGLDEGKQDHPTNESRVIRGDVQNGRSTHEIQQTAKRAVTCV